MEERESIRRALRPIDKLSGGNRPVSDSPTYMLDWQAFTTHAEAETAAKELARTSETYTIKTATGGCKRSLDVVEEAMRRQAALDRTRAKTRRTEQRV